MFTQADCQKVWAEPIYQAREIDYYSCRAPNGEFYLLAESRSTVLAETMQSLHSRRSDWLKQVNLVDKSVCKTKRDNCQRRCINMNFLPRIVNQFNEDGLQSYLLDFHCLQFGKLVQASRLVEDYYLAIPRLCQVTVSLLDLINFLTHLEVAVDLSIDNLLIDLDSAYVTLLDWSQAKSVEKLTARQVLVYYQKLMPIVVQLLDAEKVDGYWRPKAEPKNLKAHYLLETLEEYAQIEYHLPERNLNNALDYLENLQAKICQLPEKMISLACIKVDEFVTIKPRIQNKEEKAE